MKVIVVPNKKEWIADEWKPDEFASLPVEEDVGMPPRTYKVREVEG